MSDASKPDGQTVDQFLTPQLALVRERFESAWKLALSDPPRVEEFLAGLVEPERSRLRGEMERLDQQFRRLWDSRTGRATAREAPARPGGTVDYQPVVSVSAVAPQA